MPHSLVYEINTRCWLRDLSDRIKTTITLANVPDAEFQGWQRLGFTHLWLMGVWTSGPRSRAVALAVSDLQKAYGGSAQSVCEADIVGSPYAIAEYRVSERLGGDLGLQTFRRKLHQYGIKLLLDFVPNHIGLDHPWLRQRPELMVQSHVERPGTFAQGTKAGHRWLAHGKDPHFASWTDTAQLDYRLHATHSAMREQLLSVAEQCDGVRCDMAMLLLNEVFEPTWKDFPPADQGSESGYARSEFWADSIRATRRLYPGFLFLAEVYWGLESRLQSLGFDFTYNKEIYDELVRHNPAGVQEKLLRSTPEFLAASTHFLENHDEPRIASLLAFPEHRVAAALLLAFPGMRLLHEGQLDGVRIRNPVQLGCRVSAPVDFKIRGLYEQLIEAFRNTIVGKGECTVLKPQDAGDSTARNIILLKWTDALEVLVVAINLSPEHSQCFVPMFPNPPEDQKTVRDLIGSGEISLGGGNSSSNEGFGLALPGYGAKLIGWSDARK